MAVTYTGSDKRLQYLFTHGGGGGGGADIWVGTLAEYTQQAAQIADGTTVLITDDEDNYITEYHVYSTEERVIGQWVDGSTIYEKTFDFGSSQLSVASQTWTDSPILKAGYGVICDVKGVNNDGAIWNIYGARSSSSNTNYIQLFNTRSAAINIRYLIMQYTKTS